MSQHRSSSKHEKNRFSLSMSSSLTTPSTDSFSHEVLHRMKQPMLYFFVIWMLISAAIIAIYYISGLSPNGAVVVGAVLSILGTSLILFSASNAETHDRNAFHFIYFLTICDWLFAVKMLLSGAWVLSGRSLDWQERHTGWCYFSALLGQWSAMASMGWSCSVVLDLLLIVFYPLNYGRHKKEYLPYYHAAVWSVATISCVPPLVAGEIGMSTDKTCWFLNDYVWCFWVLWYIFVAFALCSVAAIYMKLRPDSESSSAVDKISIIHVRVVVQSWLITYTFFLCWFWNGMFRMIIAANKVPPAWLVPLQIFWLGAVGFSNSIVWFPFIRRAIAKAHNRLTTTSSVSQIVRGSETPPETPPENSA